MLSRGSLGIILVKRPDEMILKTIQLSHSSIEISKPETRTHS